MARGAHQRFGMGASGFTTKTWTRLRLISNRGTNEGSSFNYRIGCVSTIGLGTTASKTLVLGLHNGAYNRIGRSSQSGGRDDPSKVEFRHIERTCSSLDTFFEHVQAVDISVSELIWL